MVEDIEDIDGNEPDRTWYGWRYEPTRDRNGYGYGTAWCVYDARHGYAAYSRNGNDDAHGRFIGYGSAAAASADDSYIAWFKGIEASIDTDVNTEVTVGNSQRENK